MGFSLSRWAFPARTAFVVAGLLAPAVGGAASLEVTPAAPAYGQAVSIELTGWPWPQYLPASRFSRAGNAFALDFEYTTNGFTSGASAAYGYRAMPVGELVPGSYTVSARLSDRDHPEAAPQMVTASFQVAPPDGWGAYVVPVVPRAWEATSVYLRSAAYLDPATVVASRSGNVIRVDFDYAPDAPSTGPAPPGLAASAAVAIDGLPPGAYLVEAYGRSRSDGAVAKFFTRDFTVAAHMAVVEYFHPVLRHYFMAGGPDEVKLLDAGGQGGWKRTGQIYHAWLRQAEGPSGARAVCRFYAAGPNTHFFTVDPGECQQLKDLEARQRAEAAAAGRPFLGWGYEGVGFWAVAPSAGQCPADSDPVTRFYNNRAAQNDSNHRFTVDSQLQASMSMEWVHEGVQLCSLRAGP